jgi:hypothetical protein
MEDLILSVLTEAARFGIKLRPHTSIRAAQPVSVMPGKPPVD